MEFVQQVAGLFLILVLNLRKTHTIFSWRTNLKEKIPADLEAISTTALPLFSIFTLSKIDFPILQYKSSSA